MIDAEDVPRVLPQTAAAADARRTVPTLDLRSCAQAEERPPVQPQCAAPSPAAPVTSDARAAPTAPLAEASAPQSSLRAAAQDAENAPRPPHIKGLPADRKACQAPAQSPPPPEIDVPTRASHPCSQTPSLSPRQNANSNDSLYAHLGTPRSSPTWNGSELKDGVVRRGRLVSCAQALRYRCKLLFRAICPRRSGSPVSDVDLYDAKADPKQLDEECPQELDNVNGTRSVPHSDCPKLEPVNGHSEDLMRGAPDLRSESTRDGGEVLQSSLPHTPTTPRAAEAAPSHSKDQPTRSQFSSTPNQRNSSTPEGPTVSEPADSKGIPSPSAAPVAAPSKAAVSTLERTVDAIMWKLREVTPPAERKRVFIEQCRAWHPDKNAGDLQRATLAFQRLQATRVWFLCSDDELIAMFGSAGPVNSH